METPVRSILITGGAGYIGSHVFLALVQSGEIPVFLDNFSNSHPSILKRLERITQRPVVCEQGSTVFVQDVLERQAYFD